MRNRILKTALIWSAFAFPAHTAETDLFYLPKAEDARFQKIAKTGNETRWPFTVEEGLLACIYAMGRPLVMFLVENGTEPDGVTPEFRLVVISLDPFEAIFNNMAVNDLIADDGGNAEKRLTLFGPFFQLGKRLCEQPKGTKVGPGEL